MQRTEPLPQRPWVIVGPDGVFWLGHANSEQQAWNFALGWPTRQEIDDGKALGFYAAEATVTWKRHEATVNRYCRIGMCVSTDEKHEPWCVRNNQHPGTPGK